jgi:hypothetical protein
MIEMTVVLEMIGMTVVVESAVEMIGTIVVEEVVEMTEMIVPVAIEMTVEVIRIVEKTLDLVPRLEAEMKEDTDHVHETGNAGPDRAPKI